MCFDMNYILTMTGFTATTAITRRKSAIIPKIHNGR